MHSDAKDRPPAYSGRSFDSAALVASLAAFTTQSYNKSVGRGDSPFVPVTPTSAGGCPWGCLSAYNLVSVEATLNLWFDYDDKGKITGASYDIPWNPNATFIGPESRQIAKKE